jgi:hypothetical protein
MCFRIFQPHVQNCKLFLAKSKSLYSRWEKAFICPIPIDEEPQDYYLVPIGVSSIEKPIAVGQPILVSTSYFVNTLSWSRGKVNSCRGRWPLRLSYALFCVCAIMRGSRFSFICINSEPGSRINHNFISYLLLEVMVMKCTYINIPVGIINLEFAMIKGG